jgi:hypothetical protein
MPPNVHLSSSSLLMSLLWSLLKYSIIHPLRHSFRVLTYPTVRYCLIKTYFHLSLVPGAACFSAVSQTSAKKPCLILGLLSDLLGTLSSSSISVPSHCLHPTKYTSQAQKLPGIMSTSRELRWGSWNSIAHSSRRNCLKPKGIRKSLIILG